MTWPLQPQRLIVPFPLTVRPTGFSSCSNSSQIQSTQVSLPHVACSGSTTRQCHLVFLAEARRQSDMVDDEIGPSGTAHPRGSDKSVSNFPNPTKHGGCRGGDRYQMVGHLRTPVTPPKGSGHEAELYTSFSFPSRGFWFLHSLSLCWNFYISTLLSWPVVDLLFLATHFDNTALAHPSQSFTWCFFFCQPTTSCSTSLFRSFQSTTIIHNAFGNLLRRGSGNSGPGLHPAWCPNLGSSPHP